MPKNIVIVASGRTEGVALPRLLRCLAPDIVVGEVRFPSRNKQLSVEAIAGLIKAAWYKKHDDARPKKFVVVVDVDQAMPADVLDPIRKELPERLDGIDAEVQYAYARQHLEAWYFADVANLKRYLRRSPGSVDTSRPDEIENPKHHLKQVLRTCGKFYTAEVSAEIAERLDAETIAERSPSFRIFMNAVKNGSHRVASAVATDSRESGRSSGTVRRSWLGRLQDWRRR